MYNYFISTNKKANFLYELSKRTEGSVKIAVLKKLSSHLDSLSRSYKEEKDRAFARAQRDFNSSLPSVSKYNR